MDPAFESMRAAQEWALQRCIRLETRTVNVVDTSLEVETRYGVLTGRWGKSRLVQMLVAEGHDLPSRSLGGLLASDVLRVRTASSSMPSRSHGPLADVLSVVPRCTIVVVPNSATREWLESMGPSRAHGAAWAVLGGARAAHQSMDLGAARAPATGPCTVVVSDRSLRFVEQWLEAVGVAPRRLVIDGVGRVDLERAAGSIRAGFTWLVGRTWPDVIAGQSCDVYTNVFREAYVATPVAHSAFKSVWVDLPHVPFPRADPSARRMRWDRVTRSLLSSSGAHGSRAMKRVLAAMKRAADRERTQHQCIICNYSAWCTRTMACCRQTLCFTCSMSWSARHPRCPFCNRRDDMRNLKFDMCSPLPSDPDEPASPPAPPAPPASPASPPSMPSSPVRVHPLTMGVTLQPTLTQMFDIEISMSDSSFAAYTEVTPDGVLGTLIISVLQAMAGLAAGATGGPVAGEEDQRAPAASRHEDPALDVPLADIACEDAIAASVRRAEFPVVLCPSPAAAACIEAAATGAFLVTRSVWSRDYRAGRAAAILIEKSMPSSIKSARVVFSVDGCRPEAHTFPSATEVVFCATKY